MSHYTGFGPRSTVTPQTEPIPGSPQQVNNAGGYSFVVDDMTRLKRFLILGAVGGTYYVGERKLTKENLDCVERLLKAGRGKEVVELIVAISDAGRGVSNDPALFALARCCACDVHGKTTKTVGTKKTYELHREHHPALFEKYLDEEPHTITLPGKQGTVIFERHGDVITKTLWRPGGNVQVDHPDDIVVRQAAYAALPKVARIGTHLFHFMMYVKQFRGRGRAHRHALKRYYNLKRAESLAYQLLKYQSRDGWSQRDVLRLTRPHPGDFDHNALYHWVTKGWDAAPETVPAEGVLGLIWGFELAKHAADANEVADLIVRYKLPREAVPTEHLKSVAVWEALLAEMPLEAMIRTLGVMTANGTLAPLSKNLATVVARLRDGEAIRKARLHPIKLLAALKTYEQGHGEKGKLKWTTIPQLVDALNDAFYLAFGNVTPSGKRLVLALDVSGSMGYSLIGSIPGLSARAGAAAMALVTAATEPNYTMMAFSRGFVPLSISPKQRLDDVVRHITGLPFDGTDCSLPMLWATQHRVQADAFIIYTDSETWAGRIHPVQALRQYRAQFNIPAKLCVVGMTATQFTIADPDDAGMLDVVGFDTATPQVLSEFLSGL